MDFSALKIKNGCIDFISGIVLFVFSILVFIYGIYILNTMNLGKGVEWYTSPALMPLFIGTVMGILSILLIFKNRQLFIVFFKTRKDVTKDNSRKINIKDAFIHYKDNQIIRFMITFVLLVLYVFVLIGRIPFLLATFLYLVSNMVIFRENNYAIWKLMLISFVTSIAINYGFGVVAKIPLP